VARGRDATRSSLRSRFGSAIHQFARRFGSARSWMRTSKYAQARRVLGPRSTRLSTRLQSAFRQCDSTPEGRATISGLHRPRPRRNSLPDRGLAAERLPRTARGDHLVLKRLSRHGGSPRDTRGCSCGGGAPRGRRWRHPQHLRYASSNSRARSGIVTSSVFTAHHWAQDSLIRAKRRRLRRYRLPTSRCGRSGRIGCGCAANL
jgi:hypothetical protein